MSKVYIDFSKSENRLLVRKNVFIQELDTERFGIKPLEPFYAETLLMHPLGRIISPDYCIEDRIRFSRYSMIYSNCQGDPLFSLDCWDGVPEKTMAVEVYHLGGTDKVYARFLTDPDESTEKQQLCFDIYLFDNHGTNLDDAVKIFGDVEDKFIRVNGEDPLASTVEYFEENQKLAPNYLYLDFQWDYIANMDGDIRLPDLPKDYRGFEPYIPHGWHPMERPEASGAGLGQDMADLPFLLTVSIGKDDGIKRERYEREEEIDGEIVRFHHTFVIDPGGKIVPPASVLETRSEDGTRLMEVWELEEGVQYLIAEILDTKFGNAFKHLKIPDRISLEQAMCFHDILGKHKMGLDKTTPIDNAKVYSKVRQAKGK